MRILYCLLFALCFPSLGLGLALGQERVVLLVGESEYGSAETMTAFATDLETRLNLDVDLRLSEGNELPPVPSPDEADLLVLFLRFRQVDDAQLAQLGAWFDAGKPVVALRTTSHAFLGHMDWFPPYFGGHYKSHAPNGAGTRTVIPMAARTHPILRGIPLSMEMGHGGTYDTQPLSDGASVLMFGRTGDLPTQPVAWTFEYKPGARIFYTSMGSIENFGRRGFRTLLANAVLWGLEKDVPARGAYGNGGPNPPAPASTSIPAPPVGLVPPGAEVLFDGTDLKAWRHWDPSVEPRAIRIDGRADTSAGGPVFELPRWPIEGRALIARPGFGDLVTRGDYADYHLHLDFLVPEERGIPDNFRGASGVYVAGRYEIALLDSYQKDLSDESSGALFGQHSPSQNASAPPNTWQSLDLSYRHAAGENPRLSVWLNDVQVLKDVTLEKATSYGFLRPLPGPESAGEARHVASKEDSARCDWGKDSFSVSTRFRSTAGGTLVAKCPPSGQWVADAKALFLRGGHLVYDIGWIGALSSKNTWADGDWHRVVLTSHEGQVRLYVDGELEAEREDFRAKDKPAFVLKAGEANDNFGGTYNGEMKQLRFYDRALSPKEAAALAGGKNPKATPTYTWNGKPDKERESRPRREAGDPVPSPIRLQADCSPVRFANIWVLPLGSVDHAGLVASLDHESYERGEVIFRGTCLGCHGADGLRTLNPKARPFARGILENGSDPLSLFHTVTKGYQEMPSNEWLRPDQRYDVIHYVRERFLREENKSQYFGVTDAYLNGLPKGVPAELADESDLPRRDYGPVLASQLGDHVGSALTVRLDDETSMSYDLQVMGSPAAWTGGFLDLAETQHHKQRGEGRARPGGELMAGLEAWGWGHGGSLDWDRSRRPARGPLPKDWLDYHGHYLHGDQVVLSYAIDSREVLEVPGVDRSSGLPVITHRITVAAGDTELLLALANAPEGDDLTQYWTRSSDEQAGLHTWQLGMTAHAPLGEEPKRFAAAATLAGGQLEADDQGRLFLRVPASSTPTELYILRLAGTSADQLRGFENFLNSAREQSLPVAPETLTHGGPARWGETLTSSGQLGAEDGPYTVDSIALPESNPWNAWLRTSALDFYQDGRAAVSMYGGDLWIVSGIDKDLKQLEWRRFAAGMFEPMGVRVIGGQLFVGCRDRITRLHDLNGDGEADFYESFFPDPDVSVNFHAFNFDLQTDTDGAFYYAKSGQYTDFSLGGGILKVAPDGRSHEVYSTGLRTPNGMGMSPDGRPLVSDNQGNWIPASKISLGKPGAFHGVFPAINTNGPGKQTREDFDQPVIWMPQSLDSSSGGQLWLDDDRFGPLAGRYLHTSFGKGWMYVLMVEDLGDVAQAGIYRLPFQFDAGLQRLRTNPSDGQVYTVGLSGWQGPGGGADGCLQRLRYTGKPSSMLLESNARPGRVELTFSAPLNRELSLSKDNYRAKRWNYLWTRNYGSDHYSLLSPGQKGEDNVSITSLELSADGKTLSVGLADLVPVHQLMLEFDLLGADGKPVTEQLYMTINRIPED